MSSNCSGSTSPDGVPGRFDRALPIATEELPATGAPDLLGHPMAVRRTAGRATRGRRRAGGLAPLAPLGDALSRRSPSRSRRLSTRSTAASSASAIAPTVEIVLRMPSIERRLERDDRDVGVDRAGDLVDLAIADRADVAQLLGQDQVGLGGLEGRLVELDRATSRRGSRRVTEAVDLARRRRRRSLDARGS